ncbi:BnaC01g00530D [Brassica napus]|uniref:BnaC01g00530D protein n=1 Tax=Brassica napus TaxID=3708 RepID=A0A078HY72_BRANA|nr:BnaC01g00530D [Brassica napus]
MQLNATRADVLADKGLSELYVSNGQLKKPGTIIHNRKLAFTLKQIAENGKVKAVVGASGGANIIAATTEVFLNHFFLNMDPLSSVLAPRIYHQLTPNKVSFENLTTVFGDHFEIPKETRVVLEKKGHVLTPMTGATIVQFIVQESEGNAGGMSKLVAVSDPKFISKIINSTNLINDWYLLRHVSSLLSESLCFRAGEREERPQNWNLNRRHRHY